MITSVATLLKMALFVLPRSVKEYFKFKNDDILGKFSLIQCCLKFFYSYTLHNCILVNSRLHTWWWSCKILMKLEIFYHLWCRCSGKVQYNTLLVCYDDGINKPSATDCTNVWHEYNCRHYIVLCNDSSAWHEFIYLLHCTFHYH